jgi:hypothetical protein
MEGLASMYSWSAQLKGMGRAKGVDMNIHATGKSWMAPKDVGKAKDQAVFTTSSGDMGMLKCFALSKMTENKPKAVSLWHFMTNSKAGLDERRYCRCQLRANRPNVDGTQPHNPRVEISRRLVTACASTKIAV